ncbi:hypothetical protein [Portibacter lacus]|uniref:Uncharacterized protein n=1 Tax=Portibacter lacus TaxID=1099794 RepID=A0AA37STG3_9BACT|nr:hypothetical protein [Portibacter lacus]GLR19787.1 hypothetical protein GCM10007940_44030 [Portibacter lacus]
MSTKRLFTAPYNMTMKYLLFFIVLVCVGSCAKEYGYDVDPEIQPFFDLFEEEAALRGITVDLDAAGIGATIDFIRDNSTVGQCQNSDEGNRRVLVDKSFWADYDYYGKEFIIFHELGHCYLDRLHENSVLTGNICASIMQSGVSGCINAYGEETREEYLNELFGQ